MQLEYLMMIDIKPGISIDESELHLDFIRASGPGGQNVNKVSSAVQLRFDAMNSPALNEQIRKRLLRIAGRRASNTGTIVIKAQRFRSQEKNRQDAVDRLVMMIRQAATVPRIRKKTKPSRAAMEKRISTKHHRSRTKKFRKRVGKKIRSDLKPLPPAKRSTADWQF